MTSRPGHKGNALTTGFCVFLLTFSWHIFSVHRPEGRNLTSRRFLDFRHRVSHFCLEPGSHIFPASICVTAAAFPWRVSHPSSWCTRLDSRTQTRMFSPPQIRVILKPTKQNMSWKWINFSFNSSDVLKSSIPFSDPECHCHRDWFTEAGHDQHFQLFFFSYEFLAYNDYYGLRGWKKGFQS